MFIGITNTPRDYAWGSRTAIADALGRTPSGSPEAELWLGAHPGSPSVLTDPSAEQRTLDGWLAAHPGEAPGGRLPYLLKLLAAGSPLSLQAHPTPEQAVAGFARENAAGLAVDAPDRNYRDPYPKPEIIVALSPTFDALAGFRSVAESRLLLAELAAVGAPEVAAFADRLVGADDAEVLRDSVGWLLSGGAEVQALVAAVVRAAAAHTAPNSSFTREFATVAELAEQYPGDAGLVVSLLLNRVTLRRGQGLFLPAGNIHAYLSGLGVELMTASDNVLRGGLTAKHIDVAELLDVAVFTPLPAPLLQPEHPAAGVTIYRPGVDGFLLVEVVVGDGGADANGPQSASFTIAGPSIAIVLDGSVTVTGALGAASLAQGDAVFVTGDERSLTITGTGRAFVATLP